jgi:hypothetical protein
MIGTSKLEIPDELMTELLRLPCNALEVSDDGVSRLKLLEEELPITAQDYHGRARASVDIRHDPGGDIRMIDHNHYNPLHRVAVDLDSAAAAIRKRGGRSLELPYRAVCLIESLRHLLYDPPPFLRFVRRWSVPGLDLHNDPKVADEQ